MRKRGTYRVSALVPDPLKDRLTELQTSEKKVPLVESMDEEKL